MINQCDIPYWNRPAETLLRKLGSEPVGLTTNEAKQRLLVHGWNQLKATTERSAWRLFFGQFKNPTVLLLLFATAVSALLGDWVEALIIFLIVLGSAGLSAVTLALPYSPVSTLLGFAPLSVGVLLALAGVTLLYVAASEIAKHYFYRYVKS